MSDAPCVIKDAAALRQAVQANAKVIEIEGRIADLKSFKLPAGTTLQGVDGQAELHFAEGQPGLMLSADHRIRRLRLVTDETQIALGLADEAEDLGTLDIADVRTLGRFHLEASRAKRGQLKLADIHVERADARLAAHRPAGFGVEVLLGGLVVYNASKDTASRWTLEARNLSGGSKAHPLRGSGVFVFGGSYIPPDSDPATTPAPTRAGGMIEVSLLTTGEIHAEGGIPKGIGNLITGGVFIGSGVHARSVVGDGPVTTYGPNDMVLDNWGKVDAWTAKAALTSHESSGIGFVNFGDIGELTIAAPIATHGLGARGFNLYDGTLQAASFQDITTLGDGAIGIQLSRPFGAITVNGDIRTKGGEGESLVRGRVVHLKAHALSLKPGTRGDVLRILGQAIAENAAIPDLDFEAPASVIKDLEINGKRLS